VKTREQKLINGIQAIPLTTVIAPSLLHIVNQTAASFSSCIDFAHNLLTLQASLTLSLFPSRRLVSFESKKSQAQVKAHYHKITRFLLL
jgi:hypothetical protein